MIRAHCHLLLDCRHNLCPTVARYRPWDFEGTEALLRAYKDPAWGFIRRQHYYLPIAHAAKSTPVMQSYFADHIFPSRSGPKLASDRGILCMFTGRLDTVDQRSQRQPLINILRQNTTPCEARVWAAPHRVQSAQHDGEVCHRLSVCSSCFS